MRMTLLAMVFVGCSLLACSSGSPFIADYEVVVNEYCACKDLSCAEGVVAKIKTLTGEYEGEERESLSEGEKKKVDAISARMLECMIARTDGKAGRGP